MKWPGSVIKQPINLINAQWLSQIPFIHRVILIFCFLYLCNLYAWQVVSLTRNRCIKQISRLYSYLILSFMFCSIFFILYTAQNDILTIHNIGMCKYALIITLYFQIVKCARITVLQRLKRRFLQCYIPSNEVGKPTY